MTTAPEGLLAWLSVRGACLQLQALALHLDVYGPLRPGSFAVVGCTNAAEIVHFSAAIAATALRSSQDPFYAHRPYMPICRYGPPLMTLACLNFPTTRRKLGALKKLALLPFTGILDIRTSFRRFQ
ncbi:hypothetical protein BKA70DRAFT_1466633 [Coprinopsis sp. MPI-PUGE-AT-0042]|nr:hypothetical protein BKA70DRAFT_1466633 [Coprinopsis sp. MPI-PUGE-AT-0042]